MKSVIPAKIVNEGEGVEFDISLGSEIEKSGRKEAVSHRRYLKRANGEARTPISIRFGNTAEIDVWPSTAPAGLPDYKPIFGRPVELVRKAIAEITSTDEGKELPEITVDVMPGGRPKDPYCNLFTLNLLR